jgi:hypothetical protein
MPGIMTLNLVFFAFWLVSYLISLALFVLSVRAFSQAFQRLILSFESRADGSRQPLSLAEELAYAQAEKLNRRYKVTFAFVSALFLVGQNLPHVLAFEGLIRIVSTIVPGALFLPAFAFFLRTSNNVDLFADAIQVERSNPARAAEFQ